MAVYELMMKAKTGEIEGASAPVFKVYNLRTKMEVNAQDHYKNEVKKYKLVRGYGFNQVNVVAYI